MSQQDSICDTAPGEQTFGLPLRSFREELSQYAAQIPSQPPPKRMPPLPAPASTLGRAWLWV